MLKIDISINQIISHLFELVLIRKKEHAHQIKYFDKVYLQMTYFFPIYQLNIGVLKLFR